VSTKNFPQNPAKHNPFYCRRYTAFSLRGQAVKAKTYMDIRLHNDICFGCFPFELVDPCKLVHWPSKGPGWMQALREYMFERQLYWQERKAFLEAQHVA
jgi:hypothetical protein